jgi:hypothetical protein
MEKSAENGKSTHQSESTSRHGDRSLIEIVQEQPVACLAIAAAAGFVLGGGMRRTNGLALLALMGQMAMRDALGQIVNGALRDNHAG